MDELTDAQVEALTAKLRALEAELRATIDKGREGAQVVSLDEPIGRLSRMDAMQQQKMAEAAKRQAELRLGQVQVALAAVADGEYGYCRSCEEPIGIRRLTARPESPFCLSCQGRRER